MSKLIREKIHKRYGQSIRYPKDCHALAEEISNVSKAKISASTLKRLYGFVKGASQEPRLYTLDLIAAYLGYKTWEELVRSLDPNKQEEAREIEKIRPSQIPQGHVLLIEYAPGKKIRLKRTSESFRVLSSNDKKLLPEDEVEFKVVELYYPLTFSKVWRRSEPLGTVQLATVSGVTSIIREDQVGPDKK